MYGGITDEINIVPHAPKKVNATPRSLTIKEIITTTENNPNVRT